MLFVEALPQQSSDFRETLEGQWSLGQVEQSGRRHADVLRARLLAECVAEDSAVSPIAGGKRVNGGREIGTGEVRPHDAGEVELGVGGLPEQAFISAQPLSP